MKRCSGCLQTLDITSFAFKNRIRGIRQARCRSCVSLRASEYYRRDPSRYKARAAASKVHVLAANRSTLREYLRSHPCVECGLQDLAVLEFDHRRQEECGLGSDPTRGVLEADRHRNREMRRGLRQLPPPP